MPGYERGKAVPYAFQFAVTTREGTRIEEPIVFKGKWDFAMWGKPTSTLQKLIGSSWQKARKADVATGACLPIQE